MCDMLCGFCGAWKCDTDDFCGGDDCLKRKNRRNQINKDSIMKDENKNASFPLIVGYTISALNEISSILVNTSLSNAEINKALTKTHETLRFIQENLPNAMSEYNSTQQPIMEGENEEPKKDSDA